jgi:hypothetical protein
MRKFYGKTLYLMNNQCITSQKLSLTQLEVYMKVKDLITKLQNLDQKRYKDE